MAVIVPAHDEGRVIGRLLSQLTAGIGPGDAEIIVVANGCTDNTVQVAEEFGPPVRVVETPVPSKRAALAAGDAAAGGFPRVYVDADVELGTDDLRALESALKAPGILAAAPERKLDVTRSSWPVRWYFEVWSLLPNVRQGLFGRGVIAVNETGHSRITNLPPLMADDLAASLVFGSEERVIVEGSQVTVHAPRTLGDLLRRRIRVVTGVSQIERSADTPESTERTSVRDLVDIVKRRPPRALKIAIFLLVTMFARWQGNRRARRSDYTTWLRDESSRN